MDVSCLYQTLKQGWGWGYGLLGEVFFAEASGLEFDFWKLCEHGTTYCGLMRLGGQPA